MENVNYSYRKGLTILIEYKRFSEKCMDKQLVKDISKYLIENHGCQANWDEYLINVYEIYDNFGIKEAISVMECGEYTKYCLFNARVASLLLKKINLYKLKETENAIVGMCLYAKGDISKKQLINSAKKSNIPGLYYESPGWIVNVAESELCGLVRPNYENKNFWGDIHKIFNDHIINQNWEHEIWEWDHDKQESELSYNEQCVRKRIEVKRYTLTELQKIVGLKKAITSFSYYEIYHKSPMYIISQAGLDINLFSEYTTKSEYNKAILAMQTFKTTKDYVYDKLDKIEKNVFKSSITEEEHEKLKNAEKLFQEKIEKIRKLPKDEYKRKYGGAFDSRTAERQRIHTCVYERISDRFWHLFNLFFNKQEETNERFI